MAVNMEVKNAREPRPEPAELEDDDEVDEPGGDVARDSLSRSPSNTSDEKVETEKNAEDEAGGKEEHGEKEDEEVAKEHGEAESSGDAHVSQALAFTIDFGEKEVDTARYQNLFERYNARHRRNLSASKAEEYTKKASSLLSPCSVQKQKLPSTHSEGYFSSEDDTRRKADQLAERLKHLGLKSFTKSNSKDLKKSEVPQKTAPAQTKEDLMTRSYDEPSKYTRLTRQNLSLELERTTKSNMQWLTQKSATINDLSRVQANNYDDDNEKSYTKNIEYIDTDNKYKEENTIEHSPDTFDEKVSNINYVLGDLNITSTSSKEKDLSNDNYTMTLETDVEGDPDLEAFNVSNADAGSDGAVSEAGTYTIHKDYTDEEKARMDIDNVFSIGVLTEDESNENYVHNFKMSVSRDNNTWISEWATQVAEHNSLPLAIGGTTGRTPPLSPTKIPSPIHARSQRTSRSHQEQSDSSIDAESYLRIKERIGLFCNQSTLIDSGGESDDDTSNSYNTPPHSSQRTPVHTSLMRRSSLSESLFKRINTSENRRSARKYMGSGKSKTEEANAESLKSPSQVLPSLHLGRRSSSLDRKEYTSDTTESNTSRRNSIKYYQEEDSKHTNSPILNRLRPSTSKLTNSPIAMRKTSSTKIINSPMLERSRHLGKSSQAKNVGYFTCVENSPYMLRKSNSTTSYQEGILNNTDVTVRSSELQNNPEYQRHLNIQRSSSNASIRNVKAQNTLSRRSSCNSSDADKGKPHKGRFLVASDSSSETGEQQAKLPAPISSGVKLNRAFSVRRTRLMCESDTTPNTTPEERRRRTQTETKPTALLNKQQAYYRTRTSNVNKEYMKKPEPPKPRTSSISRTDISRYSMRPSKVSHHASTMQRPNQKSGKDHKKSGRSNSTLTSKEVEFQNWKRRKSYDPMKAAAEGRKKLIDSTKKHHSTEDSSENHDNSVLRSASFHGTDGALSLANEGSDDDLILPRDDQVPFPRNKYLFVSKQESDSDLETSFYLQTTQTVMSSLAARLIIQRSALIRHCDNESDEDTRIRSDNESDEDTSHSLHESMPKSMRQPSDTESSDECPPPIPEPHMCNTKYNRAFSSRRARLEPQSTKTSISNVNKTKLSLHGARSKTESVASMNRTDSGRFSMRLNRSSNVGLKGKPKETKKSAIPNAREVEMQNWKRRKSYDPMKAAMEGRRKAGLAKRNANANLSPSSVARSQSFHGSAGLGTSDWSEEEVVVSADEAPLY